MPLFDTFNLDINCNNRQQNNNYQYQSFTKLLTNRLETLQLQQVS